MPFTLHETSDGNQSTFDFSRTFLSPTGVPFTLHKTYVFDKDEYLFELRVTIENSVNDFPAPGFRRVRLHPDPRARRSARTTRSWTAGTTTATTPTRRTASARTRRWAWGS